MIEATRLTRAGKLAEAAALLRGLLGGARPAADPPAPPEPSGGSSTGQFLDRKSGSLDYKLYVPSGLAPGAPLLVMLHGCTQSPEDFAAGTQMNVPAEARGILVAYPAQSRNANPQKCWNWFSPPHQQRGQGEPAAIAAMTRELIAEYGVDPKRVFVAGLSAGGAAAAVMGEAYPDLFAGVGVHSGLAAGSARDVTSALAARKRGGMGTRGAAATPVPTITFHGDRDMTVHEGNAGEVVARAAAAAGPLHTTTQTGTSAGGRSFTRSISRDAKGRGVIEQWTVHGSGHAWSGGSNAGSYTDPAGPDASAEMLRFFMAL
ncbi:hypothetical protein BH09PSE4_BH09PSE4_23230 [soil metagenome]